jgi:hypothetical protein
MNAEYFFETILIILKIIIISLWIIDIYLKYAPVEYRFLDMADEQFWQKRISVLFDLFVAFLLIYLFNPFYSHKIHKMTKFTLFMFGFLIIFRINWSIFTAKSPVTNHLKSNP